MLQLDSLAKRVRIADLFFLYVTGNALTIRLRGGVFYLNSQRVDYRS